jgi:hypothetical protein
MCKAWLTSRDDDATLSLKDQFTNVGRNRISFTSTSSGWLMANATAPANDSAGVATSAYFSRRCLGRLCC